MGENFTLFDHKLNGEHRPTQRHLFICFLHQHYAVQIEHFPYLPLSMQRDTPCTGGTVSPETTHIIAGGQPTRRKIWEFFLLLNCCNLCKIFGLTTRQQVWKVKIRVFRELPTFERLVWFHLSLSAADSAALGHIHFFVFWVMHFSIPYYS